jgi:hypothetical protein
MTTSTREHASRGGRDHQNARRASIGTGGRFRSESPADFIGMRIERLEQLATKHNVGNATLGRQTIRKYLLQRNSPPLAVE